jgi:hypothetical protein
MVSIHAEPPHFSFLPATAASLGTMIGALEKLQGCLVDGNTTCVWGTVRSDPLIFQGRA